MGSLQALTRGLEHFPWPALLYQGPSASAWPQRHSFLRAVAGTKVYSTSRQSSEERISCHAAVPSAFSCTPGLYPWPAPIACKKLPWNRRSRSVLVRQDGDYESGGADGMDDEEGGGFGEEEVEMDDLDYDVDVDEEFDIQQGGVLGSSSHGDGKDEKDKVVDFKVNEDDFHRFRCHKLDFFVKKGPDDMHDLSEVYCAKPYSEKYMVVKKTGSMPRKATRLYAIKYESIHAKLTPVEWKRGPLVKENREVHRVYLVRCYQNRVPGEENFLLQFDDVYCLDSKLKSFEKLPVQMEVPLGRKRNRRNEILSIRDKKVKIVTRENRMVPDQIIADHEGKKAARELEAFLQTYRDYDWSTYVPIEGEEDNKVKYEFDKEGNLKYLSGPNAGVTKALQHAPVADRMLPDVILDWERNAVVPNEFKRKLLEEEKSRELAVAQKASSSKSGTGRRRRPPVKRSESRDAGS